MRKMELLRCPWREVLQEFDLPLSKSCGQTILCMQLDWSCFLEIQFTPTFVTPLVINGIVIII